LYRRKESQVNGLRLLNEREITSSGWMRGLLLLLFPVHHTMRRLLPSDSILQSPEFGSTIKPRGYCQRKQWHFRSIPQTMLLSSDDPECHLHFFPSSWTW
jgi:hypothetical protein